VAFCPYSGAGQRKGPRP